MRLVCEIENAKRTHGQTDPRTHPLIQIEMQGCINIQQTRDANLNDSKNLFSTSADSIEHSLAKSWEAGAEFGIEGINYRVI